VFDELQDEAPQRPEASPQISPLKVSPVPVLPAPALGAAVNRQLTVDHNHIFGWFTIS